MHHAQPPNPWASPPSLPRHLDLPRPPTVPQDSRSVSRLFPPPAAAPHSKACLSRRAPEEQEPLPPVEFSQMALISSQLQWLEAELESAVDECGQVVEQNNAWLAETIQKNTKNLQYQTCARPLGRGGGGDRYGSASETPEPSPSRRRNPSLECPRSQRKPMRRGRQKGMAAVTVRLPAQHVRRTCARQ